LQNKRSLKNNYRYAYATLLTIDGMLDRILLSKPKLFKKVLMLMALFTKWMVREKGVLFLQLPKIIYSRNLYHFGEQFESNKAI